ncbi:MAG: hypothetical protein M3346_02855 [Actinomycetota bacterium]|nr:hypothetical protein [Actinomycetota bacterium]
MFEARTKWLVSIGVALAVAALAPLAYDAAVADRNTIHPSYAFDVSNKRYMAGYSDAIFVGGVQAIEEVAPPYTRYRVTVEEVLKGELDESTVVRQHGYVSGNDVEVLDEQPLLEVGESYVLMANPALEGETSDLMLIGAPLAAVQTTDSNRGEIVRDIREAIRNQEYPPGLAKKPTSAP